MILYVRLQNTLWILMLQFHAISATMTIQNRLFFWVEPQLGQAFAIFLPVFWQPPPWAVLSQELKYIEKLCCIAFSWVSETDRDRDRGHTNFIQSMKIYRDLRSLKCIPGYSRMHLNSGHLWFWNSASAEMSSYSQQNKTRTLCS